MEVMRSRTQDTTAATALPVAENRMGHARHRVGHLLGRKIRHDHSSMRGRTMSRGLTQGGATTRARRWHGRVARVIGLTMPGPAMTTNHYHAPCQSSDSHVAPRVMGNKLTRGETTRWDNRSAG